MKALVGQKIGMTQLFSDDGKMSAATIIKVDNCVVTAIKTVEKDGYDAIQIGVGENKKANKAQQGQYKDLKHVPKYIREIRGIAADDDIKVGDSIDVSNFEIGDRIDVSGVTKGKGFAGTVKKYNFRTSSKTHGGNGVVRKLGSIGSMYPQKVMKGKKMPGQMGHGNATMQNLTVSYVDSENSVIGVGGSIPGPKKSYVTIKARG
jgi:large subunit ribosomal protein L3